MVRKGILKRILQIRHDSIHSLIFRELRHILLERKCVRDEPIVISNVEVPLPDTIFHIAAYDCNLLDTFSLQGNISQKPSWRNSG